jgi:murein DD-endopeptidase MepM/ murein hydrolase activator NlpD
MSGRPLYAAVAALLTLAIGALDAMNWPCEGAALTRNFGWNDNGQPVLGMVFAGDTEALAADNGDVIFARGREDSASRLPSPLGAWTALDHGDGLISIYGRYGEGSLSSDRVEKLEPIARTGISGWSKQNGFYFILYDRKERRWINPAMIITPIKESAVPQILQVGLQNESIITLNSPMQAVGQGRYAVLINAAGAAQGAREYPLAPQRIVCSVNGAEAGSLNFDAVSARDGVLMIYRNGLVPAKQIYANFPAFETAVVILNRGQATLEVIVQDMAGNSRNSVNRIIVN